MSDWYQANQKLEKNRDNRTNMVFLSALDGIGYEPDLEKQRAQLPFGVWESDVRMAQSMMDEQAVPLSMDRSEINDIWVPGRLWPIPGPYTGMGPRNYHRSDERIWEEINERLTRHGSVDASQVEIHLDQGAVILLGSVDSRAESAMAQAAVEGVPGVTKVTNDLRVRQAVDPSSGLTDHP